MPKTDKLSATLEDDFTLIFWAFDCPLGNPKKCRFFEGNPSTLGITFKFINFVPSKDEFLELISTMDFGKRANSLLKEQVEIWWSNVEESFKDPALMFTSHGWFNLEKRKRSIVVRKIDA